MFTRRKRLNKSHGYTIVEIVIVIVIVAILATITIVAYNGIQTRANDAKIYTTVSSYQRIFELYRAVNGRLPQGYNWVCLGEQYHYLAVAPFAANQCNTSSNNVWSSALADELRPYSGGKLPDPTFASRAAAANGLVRGIIYDSKAYHVSNNATLTYYLVGRQDCPIGIFREFRDSEKVTVCNLVLIH